MSRASRVTYVTLDADRSISSGGTIYVFGIQLTNSSGGVKIVEFKNAADTSIIFRVAVADNTSINMGIFPDSGANLDQGLLIKSASSSAVTVTVIHSQSG